MNRDPVWSPDGAEIAYASTRSGKYGIYRRAADGSGQDKLLLESDAVKRTSDWSRDGRFLIFGSQSLKAFDIWAMPLSGDGKPFPLLTSEFNKANARLSPNSKWLAYASEETGRVEVYVVPFAPESDKSGKWQISTSGGAQPQWRADGKELFYVASDRKLMAVEVKATAQGFERATPQALFESPSDTPADTIAISGYAAAADGKRFLIGTRPVGDSAAVPLTVMVNWLEPMRGKPVSR